MGAAVELFVQDAELFGIKFQSAKQQREAQSYKLPSGPAFADEREFEKELKKSEVAVRYARLLGEEAHHPFSPLSWLARPWFSTLPAMPAATMMSLMTSLTYLTTTRTPSCVAMFRGTFRRAL